MDLVTAKIAVPFMPLLRAICFVLRAEPPEYKDIGKHRNCASVTVKVPGSVYDHVFYGDGLPTIEGCFELAARLMSVFLVKRYRVLVVDLNLNLRARNEECAQFYGCQYDFLRRIEQGCPPAARYELVPTEGIDYGATRIELDFLALLYQIVERFDIAITPISVLHMMNGCYLAAFTIGVPGSISPSHGVRGYIASTISAAKQTLAHEALLIMSKWYRFEVEDVNYFLLAESSHYMNAERGVYERLRARVYGVDRPHAPAPYVVEEDCTTPRGERNAILHNQQPPPPSKRPRISDQLEDSSSSDSFSL